MTATEIETTETTTTEPTPCLCGLVRIDIPQEPGTDIEITTIPRRHRQYLDTVTGDEAGWIYLETMCDATTKRTFAPGHDARLAGLLQTAARLHGSATTTDGAWAVTSGPISFAQSVSDEFAAKVAAPAPQRVGRGGKAATTKPAQVEAKVGRWVYTGREVHLGGTDLGFEYTAKDGSVKVAAKYTLV